jgi:homospermidine synthase
VLNQCSLVLEGVTLAQVVEFVVQVLVNLAASTVLDKKTTENTETAHPDNLAKEMG